MSDFYELHGLQTVRTFSTRAALVAEVKSEPLSLFMKVFYVGQIGANSYGALEIPVEDILRGVA